jgi:acyl carrier protein
MSNNPLSAEIKEFIMTEFLPNEDPNELAEDTELLTTGILDSIATIQLVSFLESSFNISIEAHEVDAEHLNRICDMAQLVSSKQTG